MQEIFIIDVWQRSKYRSSYRRCSIKKLLLKSLQYSQENTSVWISLLKRDSKTSVFLWILQNFSEHLFWKTSMYGCFCKTPLSSIFSVILVEISLYLKKNLQELNSEEKKKIWRQQKSKTRQGITSVRYVELNFLIPFSIRSLKSRILESSAL